MSTQMVRSLRMRERSSFVRRARKIIVQYFLPRQNTPLSIDSLSHPVSDAARILPRCLPIVNAQSVPDRAFPFSALFAPTALTKGLVLLFLQEKPAKTAKLDRRWPAKQARMQGKERMGKPCQ